MKKVLLLLSTISLLFMSCKHSLTSNTEYMTITSNQDGLRFSDFSIPSNIEEAYIVLNDSIIYEYKADSYNDSNLLYRYVTKKNTYKVMLVDNNLKPLFTTSIKAKGGIGPVNISTSEEIGCSIDYPINKVNLSSIPSVTKASESVSSSGYLVWYNSKDKLPSIICKQTSVFSTGLNKPESLEFNLNSDFKYSNSSIPKTDNYSYEYDVYYVPVFDEKFVSPGYIKIGTYTHPVCRTWEVSDDSYVLKSDGTGFFNGIMNFSWYIQDRDSYDTKEKIRINMEDGSMVWAVYDYSSNTLEITKSETDSVISVSVITSDNIGIKCSEYSLRYVYSVEKPKNYENYEWIFNGEVISTSDKCEIIKGDYIPGTYSLLLTVNYTINGKVMHGGTSVTVVINE